MIVTAALMVVAAAATRAQAQEQTVLDIGARDLLFADLPSSNWPPPEVTHDSPFPWSSFLEAREHLEAGYRNLTVEILVSLIVIPDLASTHYLQAWHLLRELGIHPRDAAAKLVHGVVVEVAMGSGVDVVAAYRDHSARHVTSSGASLVWEAPDSSLHDDIDAVLSGGTELITDLGRWLGPRPDPPPKGQARVSMLTPSGLYAVQVDRSELTDDSPVGHVVRAATTLMLRLMEKSKSGGLPR